MKYKFGLLVMLLPMLASAQTKTPTDSLAKVVMTDLISSWTLGIDTTANMVDIKLYNKFKSLFDINATIDDDFDVFYEYDSKSNSGSYKTRNTTPKPFDVYAHDVALQIKSMIIDSVATPDPDIKGAQNITFTIKRKISFQKTRQYVLPDNYVEEVIKGRKIKFEKKIDSANMVANLKAKVTANPEAIYKFASDNTIRVVMTPANDSTVRIVSIKSIMNNVVCTNDSIDHDAVIDEEDSVKTEFGDFTANGRLDYDLDGVPQKEDQCKTTYGYSKNKGCPFTYFYSKKEFDVFIGLQFSTAPINLPELKQLGYLDASGNNAVDESQSSKGTLKNPGTLPGVHAGAHFAWYLGQKKQIGISIGFTYSAIEAEYQLITPTVYTFKKQFDNSYFYRRRITDSSLTEGIKYNIFNVPVMFNYRVHLDKSNKAVLSLRAGPSLMVFVNTSSYNATIDVEGLYQTDPASGKIIYNDVYDPNANTNLIFTSKKINAQSPDPGASNVFSQLGSSYDFAENKLYNGKQHLTRLALAYNFDADLQYKFSEGLTIKAGPHLVYASLPERKEKYIPINNTTDEYQSIYKSNAKSNYKAFGMNIGFVYNF